MASDMLMGRGWAPEGQVTRRPAFSTTNRAAAGAGAESSMARDVARFGGQLARLIEE